MVMPCRERKIDARKESATLVPAVSLGFLVRKIASIGLGFGTSGRYAHMAMNT